MNEMSVMSVTLGYLVSTVLGGIIIFPVWRWMWSVASSHEKENPLKSPDTLAIIHGFVERFLYTSCIVLGRPEGIAVWLAFKAIMRVRIHEDDPRHVPGSSIYMVGTALSVGFGVIGGLIATQSWSLK